MVGSSGQGKTTWVKKFLEHQAVLCNPPLDSVTLCYMEYQSAYHDMKFQTKSGELKDVTLIKGITPEIVERDQINGNMGLIIDDLSADIDDKFAAALFTRISHHRCPLVY